MAEASPRANAASLGSVSPATVRGRNATRTARALCAIVSSSGRSGRNAETSGSPVARPRARAGIPGTCASEITVTAPLPPTGLPVVAFGIKGEVLLPEPTGRTRDRARASSRHPRRHRGTMIGGKKRAPHRGALVGGRRRSCQPARPFGTHRACPPHRKPHAGAFGPLRGRHGLPLSLFTRSRRPEHGEARFREAGVRVCGVQLLVSRGARAPALRVRLF